VCARLDVLLLLRVHHANNVVVHRAGEAHHGVGDWRGASDEDRARLQGGFNVHVDRSFRDASHRHEDVLIGRFGRHVRVWPDRYQPSALRRDRLQRLPPNDLSRTGAADEAVHAAVWKNDGAIAEVRRHRRPPGDDRGDRKRLPSLLQRGYSFEEVVHAQSLGRAVTYGRRRHGDTEKRTT
jgi:hypothetical protein